MNALEKNVNDFSVSKGDEVLITDAQVETLIAGAEDLARPSKTSAQLAEITENVVHAYALAGFPNNLKEVQERLNAGEQISDDEIRRLRDNLEVLHTALEGSVKETAQSVLEVLPEVPEVWEVDEAA